MIKKYPLNNTGKFIEHTYSPICEKWSASNSVMPNSLWPHGLYNPWNPLGPNTEGGSLSLLQGIWMWELDLKEGWALKNCGAREDSGESLGLQGDQPVNPKGNQSWIFIGRTDAKAEAPMFWPPDVKNWLIGKDPDAGKDWRQEEKGTTEDEMVRWHHWLNGHEFEQTGSLWWTGKPSMMQSMGPQRDTTEWLNNKSPICKKKKERIDKCLCINITELSSCTLETNTTSEINYISIGNKRKLLGEKRKSVTWSNAATSWPLTTIKNCAAVHLIFTRIQAVVESLSFVRLCMKEEYFHSRFQSHYLKHSPWKCAEHHKLLRQIINGLPL